MLNLVWLKVGTISFTLWKYFALIFLSYPLTHDYYPHHWYIFFSRCEEHFRTRDLVLFVFGVFNIRKNPWYSFAAFAYLLPLIPVRVISFPVGTNGRAWFLFMPSFGIIYSFHFIWFLCFLNSKCFNMFSLEYCYFFSIMTVMRNPAWKNDFTLFSTDVKTSTNSAKINNIGRNSNRRTSSGDWFFRTTEESQHCIRYLDKAIEIHPLYYDAIVFRKCILLPQGFSYSCEIVTECSRLKPRRKCK